MPGIPAYNTQDYGYQQQVGRMQAEQERQRQLAIKNLQEQQDIQTNASSRLGGEQGARQAALQEAQLKAAAARQAEQEGFQSNFLNQQAGIQQAAEARRQAAISGLLGQSITGTSGLLGQVLPGGLGANMPGGMGGAAGGGGAAGDEDAARGAAFAKAKDTAGLLGRSALTALQGNMSARGLGNSSIYNNEVGRAVNQGATQLGDVNREQLTSGLQNARQRASEQYQGAIQQRGQNLSFAQSALAGLMGGRAY